MHVTLQSELRQMARDVRKCGRQIAFAQVVALTRTGVDVKRAESEEMRRVFVSPNNYTLNAVFLRAATKQRPEAVVGIKDDSATSNAAIPPSKYLSAEIDGGTRHVKRFERALQLAGYMPPGWFAVPGRFARLDSFGNISRGQITQILSQLRITLVAGFTRNISTDPKKRAAAFRRAGGQYFAVKLGGRGRLRPGIYQRRDFGIGSAAPRPVILFVQSVHYDRRFDFHGVAERVAEARYDANLDSAIAQYASGGN
jgi:hypothetical protein